MKRFEELLDGQYLCGGNFSKEDYFAVAYSELDEDVLVQLVHVGEEDYEVPLVLLSTRLLTDNQFCSEVRSLILADHPDIEADLRELVIRAFAQAIDLGHLDPEQRTGSLLRQDLEGWKGRCICFHAASDMEEILQHRKRNGDRQANHPDLAAR